jgi:hypothetical protein
MTDTETESPWWTALARPFPFDPDALFWAKNRVYGKGSREFLRSLHSDHYRSCVALGKRGGVKHRGYCISKVALDVWKSPDDRSQWLQYHEAVSRLVPNL